MFFNCIRLLLLFLTCQVAAQNTKKELPPKPLLFLEGIVSTPFQERDMTISIDGKEMYYTIVGFNNTFSVIVRRVKLSDGKWSAPAMASFSGKYADLEPALSPDGKKLFFSSNRPLEGLEPKKDYDIWFTERINDTWTEPKNLGKPINTSANEFYPSVSLNGNLYYTAEYEKGIGKEDIFLARWENGTYQESVALDTAINSARWEFNAFISPDENFILFTSFGRKDDSGGGDLYISVKNTQGQWLSAKNISILNSKKLDYCPFVSADNVMFFTSSRHGILNEKSRAFKYEDYLKLQQSTLNGLDNIYWVSFDKVLESIK